MAGIGTRALILEISGTDYSDSVSSVKIVAAESDADFLSFESARAGGSRTYKLAMTLKQDVAAASLWRMIWDDAGGEVPVTVRPAGGTVISATQPTFVGTAIVSEPDGDLLGGDADKSTSARFTVEVEWEYLARPVLDATP